MNPYRQLEVAVSFFVNTHMPFYACLLQRCSIKFSTELSTASVRILPAGIIEVLINPEFFANLTNKTRVGLIHHEAQHLVLDHLDRSIGAESYRANVAMDTALNQTLTSAFLPPGALMHNNQNVPGMKDRPLEAWEFYYNLQFEYEDLKKKQALPPPPPNPPAPPSPPQDEKKESKSEFEDRFQDDEDNSQKDASGRGYGSKRVVDDHSKWKESTASPESQKRTLINTLREAMDDTISTFGNSYLPKELQKQIEETCTLPLVEWDKMLREKVGSVDFNDHEKTRNRPSRRIGLKGMGHRTFQVGKILFIIDESASMDNDDRRLVFSEVVEAAQYFPEKVDVTTFDGQVNPDIMKIGPDRVIPPRRQEGGTNFENVFKFVRDQGEPWDLIFIMTDGDATPPITKLNCEVCWVLLSEGTHENLPGDRILISKKDIELKRRVERITRQNG